MAVNAGISYPPTMPLYADRIRHARVNEPLWASPIPIIPFLVMTSVIFLIGLGSLYAINVRGWTLGTLSPEVTLILISILPALVLVLVIIFGPRASSPAYAYQVELFRDPDDARTRWNLAVVSTANIYCGEIAQSEWLSLLPELAKKDRFRALDYLRLVVRRLQRFPLYTTPDIVGMVIGSLIIAGTSLLAFHYEPVEAMLHAIALQVVLQLFLLYVYLQRWQHIRRLREVEDIFEELLPSQRPPDALPPPTDEVEEWYKAQAQFTPPHTPTDPPRELPRAPWE
ncbi:MAG TPA: hypothetical protein PLZ36_07195 [Armatimonadota bacterium]|nr:hypothetical protein [Armatimonadota bacterium]